MTSRIFRTGGAFWYTTLCTDPSASGKRESSRSREKKSDMCYYCTSSRRFRSKRQGNKGGQEMKRRKKSEIIKLGSETETSNGVYHLLRDKDRGKYVVWVQPYETWNGKKIRSNKNWHRLKNGSLGECRSIIKNAASEKTPAASKKSAAPRVKPRKK